jgi:hypothetical protein
MTSTLTVAAHEGRAHSVVKRRRISRNKNAFFIVPYRGVHRGQHRKDGLSLVDPFVREEGLDTTDNIVRGVCRVNLEAKAICFSGAFC